MECTIYAEPYIRRGVPLLDLDTWSVSSGAYTITNALTISGDYDFTIGTSNAQILGPASGSATSGAVSYSFSGDPDTGMYRYAADSIAWATGGTSRLTMTDSVLTASIPLTVGVDDTGHDFKAFGATSGYYLLWDESEDRLVVSGTVGIGVTTADNLLHVYEGDSQTSSHADAQVTIENDLTVGLQLLSGSGQENRIIFGDRYDNDIGGITYDHDDNSMRFTTNTAERMMIQDDGDVGIGGAPADFGGVNLHIADSGIASLLVDQGSYTGEFVATSGGSIYVGSRTDTNFLIVTNDTVRLNIDNAGVDAKFTTSGLHFGISTDSPTSMPSTAAAANMFFYTTNGMVYYSTSSGRFKTDVEDVTDSYADEVLNLRPVWYRSLCRDDRSDWSHWGLIAEEVAAIDPRLVHYSPIPLLNDDGTEQTNDIPRVDGDGAPVLDDDGNPIIDPGPTVHETDADGELVLRPGNVQYDRIVPLLINIIKRQDTRIAALEAA